MHAAPAPRTSRALALGVAVVAFAAQLPAAFPAAFIWDDVPLLLASDLYTSPERWVESLGVPLGMETRYWRPLATTSFLLETALHDGSAAGYRVTAALLHAASAGLAFVLLRRLLASAGAAFLAACAWALHPANVEAVTWISGRFDLLCGLFVLAALTAAHGPSAASRTGRWLVGGAAAAALLSKESGVVLPLLLLLWLMALDGSGRPRPKGGAADGRSGDWRAVVREHRRTLGAALLGLAAVAVARVERLGFLFGTSESSVTEAGGVLAHALLVGRAAAAYVGALVVPWWGASPAHHGVRPIPSDDLLGWSGLALLAAGCTAILLLWRRDRRTACLLAAFGVALAPVLQIVPLDVAGGLHAADRLLYVPSFLLVAAVSGGLLRLAPSAAPARRGLAAAAAVLVLALGAGRLALLPHWSSADRFWAWAVREAPQSPITLANRVDVLLGSGWPGDAGVDEAERLARRLRGLDPEFRYGHALLEILLIRGQVAEAARVAAEALTVRGEDPDYLVLAGRIAVETGRFDDAVDFYGRAVEASRRDAATRLHSRLAEALGGLAEARLLAGGDRLDAVETLRRALPHVARAPASAVAPVARACFVAGDTTSALEVIGDGARITAIDWPGLIMVAARAGLATDRVEALSARAQAVGVPELTLARMRALGSERAGRWDLAAMHYGRAAELAPDDARAWDDYGYALFENGDDDGCEAALRRALEADPRHGNARLHLGVLLRIVGREAEGVQVLEAALADAETDGNEALAVLLRRQLARSTEDARTRGR